MLTRIWLLNCWISHIQAAKKGNLPSVNNPEYNRFFNCLAYVMEDQLRDLCLRSMEDYIDYLMDVGVSIYFTDFDIRLKICFYISVKYIKYNYFEQYTNCGFNINVMVRDASVVFDPTFKTFANGLSMLLNSLYDAVTTLPRAEIKLGWIYPDSGSPELLKVCMYYWIIQKISYNILIKLLIKTKNYSNNYFIAIFTNNIIFNIIIIIKRLHYYN